MPERRQRGRPRAYDDKTEQNTIQSLDRALVILETLGQSGGMSLTELATELDQSPATTYRVLTTLEQHAVVEFEEPSQTWHVGAGAFRIGSAFLRRTNLVDRARPVMQTLVQETGETANLGIESDGKVLFVSQIETHAAIRAFFPPGTLSPMHASGIGKALLAQLDPAQLDTFTARGLESFTGRTLATRAGLYADLMEVRQRGYAIDDEERNEGMRCIAAPIFNATGAAIGGLSISGPTSRISAERMEQFAAHVCAAASTLSRLLGAP